MFVYRVLNDNTDEIKAGYLNISYLQAAEKIKRPKALRSNHSLLPE